MGGQSTNCKVNRPVLDVAKTEGRVDLYFHATPHRKVVEKELVAQYLPPWNGRQRQSLQGDAPQAASISK